MKKRIYSLLLCLALLLTLLRGVGYAVNNKEDAADNKKQDHNREPYQFKPIENNHLSITSRNLMNRAARAAAPVMTQI